MLEHLYVCFVDVLHVVFSRPASQHAPRGLQYIIDKEKGWRETTTGWEQSAQTLVTAVTFHEPESRQQGKVSL